MLKLNLGCSDAHVPGFVNVDRCEPADQIADLRLTWPWEDNSVDEIRAWDFIEHLPDPIHTMNELYRALKPGGRVDIVVPTTDGRGAWQDPDHKSFWNENSFFYYTQGNPHLTRFRGGNGVKCSFSIVGLPETVTLQDRVVKLHIVLEAVKPLNELDPTFRADPTLAEFTQEVKWNPSAPLFENAEERKEAMAALGVKQFAFSIIHTSARPHEWRKVYDAWLSSCANPSALEYVLTIDARWGFGDVFTYDNTKDNSAEAAHLRAQALGLRPQDKVIWNTGRRCYVDGVNLAAAASSGFVLVVNADDQYPCERWDEQLCAAFWGSKSNGANIDHMIDVRNWTPREDFVISVSTNTPKEHERNIIVMPILSRERYERFGWVFYPEYESMYADNDFAQMAKRDKCIIDARHLIFPHKHWINGERAKDEQDRAQNSEQAYNEGAKLFAARKRINFAGIPPKVEAPPSKLPMVAFITPGSVFPAPFLAAWTNLWGYLASGNKYNITHLVGYTSNAGMVRTGLVKLVMTTDYGAPVDYVMWIDDDNTVTPDQFEMLMQDLREHPEYDAVAGWTWCAKDDDPEVGYATISCGALVDLEKTADGQDVKFTKIKQLTPRDIYESSTDLIEIGYSGFPAVLMRFDLLKKAGKGMFNPYVDERCEYGFSGEDVAFFARAAVRSGARFAVDRRVKVPHYKRRAIEPVPTQEQIQEAQRVTAQLAAKY